MLCSSPGARGRPGAGVGTPASYLVDLITAGVHNASELAPLSSRALPLVWELIGSCFFEPCPKKSPSHLQLHNVSGPKEEEATTQEVPFPMDPSEAISGPLGSS